MTGDAAEAVPDPERPESVRDLCARFDETIGRLGALLSEESGLLRAQRAGDIGPLQEEKAALTRRFLRQFAQLRDNARTVEAKAPVEINRLRGRLAEFDRLVTHNLDVLEATRAVSQGVIQAVFEIAEKETGGPTCYGKDAAVAAGTAGRPTAIAIDRRL